MANTTTYLSGGRIQGRSDDDVAIAITDNMTTNLGWTANSTPSGQGYDATNDYVVFKGINTSSDETESPRISMDMQDADFLNGSNVDDTAFTAKFELRLTTYTGSSSGENRNYFGFFSHNVWGGTAGDSFALEITGEGGGAKMWRVVVGDGELHEGTSGSYKSTHFTTDAAINTTYYITFTKTGGNTHKVGISTNSDYTTGVDERTVTRSSLTGLRYFAVKGRGDTQGAANGDTTGYIDNFYISSGTEDKSKSTITDVPVGTRYEETDTRKIFRFKTVDSLKTGCLMYYTFDSTSGGLVNQATSGNGFTSGTGSTNNGTVSNVTVDTSTKKFGTGSYYSDGDDNTDPDVEIPDIAVMAGATTPYTFSYWIKTDFDQTGSDNRVIWDFAGSNQIQFFKHPTAMWKLNFNSGSDLELTGGNVAVPNDSEFHNICMTRNSSSLYTIYVDGVSKGSITQALDVNGGSAVDMSIFTYNDYSSEYWKGWIDDMGIWNRVLTAAEISVLASAGGKIDSAYAWKEKGTA